MNGMSKREKKIAEVAFKKGIDFGRYDAKDHTDDSDPYEWLYRVCAKAAMRKDKGK